MDLNAVAMFMAVVRSGSLSAAAEQSGIPLATLSRRVKRLEQELNVQLLQRSATGITLTEIGAQLYEQANRGMEALADAERNILNNQAQLKGRLRISIPPSFEPWWDLLHAFQLQYPDIILNVYSSERRVDLIHDGIDVALRIGAIADESMIARHILNYRHLLVASPLLLERLGPVNMPDDLYRLPCAVWVSDSNSLRAWQLGPQKVFPNLTFSCNDYLHLKKLALNATAITELPPFLAQQEIAKGALVPLLQQYPLPEQMINLLYPSHKHPSTIIRAYLAFCQQHAPAFLAGSAAT